MVGQSLGEKKVECSDIQPVSAMRPSKKQKSTAVALAEVESSFLLHLKINLKNNKQGHFKTVAIQAPGGRPGRLNNLSKIWVHKDMLFDKVFADYMLYSACSSWVSVRT